ncbi:class I lanthipeptide, partial [Elizabethkingia argenteiflava]
MKKIKLTKGLQINKDQISKLQEHQLNSIKGGNKA